MKPSAAFPLISQFLEEILCARLCFVDLMPEYKYVPWKQGSVRMSWDNQTFQKTTYGWGVGTEIALLSLWWEARCAETGWFCCD